MGIIKELNRDDLLNRFASHTFTETDLLNGSTLVEFKDGGSVVISSAKSSVVDNAYAKIRRVLVGDQFILHRLTTVQRIALTAPPDGTQILNIDNESIEKFENNTFESTNQVLGGNFNFQGLTKIGGDSSIAPNGALDVLGDDAPTTRIRTTRFQNNAAGAASIQVGHSRGTEGSPSTLLSGDRIGQMVFVGDDGIDTNNNGPIIRGVTTANWGISNHGSAVEFYTIANNQTTQTLVLNLSHQGYPEVIEYTVATLPNTGGGGGFIAVTDETGGYTLAFSDGTNWRRVQDRAIVV